MNRWIRSVLQRPIGVICSTLAVSITGIAGMSTSGVSLLPPVNTAAFSVRAEYAGLPAEEMQTLVTIPIERGLSSLEGLREMESTTRAGVSHLQLSFRWGAVPMESAGRLREAVDTLYPHLPEAVTRPEVTRIDPGASPAIRLAVFAADLDEADTRRIASRELRARIQQLDGVGRVVVSGGLIDEVHVTLDPQRISESGIEFTEVHSSIIEGNIEYAAGSIHEGDTELFVTTDARVSSFDELAQLYLARREERESIRISEFASVESGHAPRRSVFIVDGREAIGVEIYATPESSPADVAARVRGLLGHLRSEFGSAFDIHVAHDGSASIRNALKELAVAATLGICAALCILVLFLRDVRSAGIVALAIPVSLAFAFAILASFSVKLNLMSLAGLTIGIGMVVDNSIVVVENLNRRCTAHCTTGCAADAVSEIAGATFSGTITTIVVFFPLLLIDGVAGQVYRELAISVIAALAASYVVSVSLIPVVFLLTAGRTWTFRSAKRRSGLIEKAYATLLATALRHPAVMMLSMIAVTAAGAAGLLSLPVRLTERIDTGHVEVSLRMPPETSTEGAATRARRTAEFIRSLDGVTATIIRVTGERDDTQYLENPRSAGKSATIDAYVASGVSADSIAARVNSSPVVGSSSRRKYGESRAAIPEHEIERLLSLGSEGGFAIYGDSHEESLERAQHVLRNFMVPSEAFEIYPAESRENIIATPVRPILNNRDIEVHGAAAVLRAAVEGAHAGTLLRDGEDIDIRLFLGDDTRIESLSALPISAGREAISLSEVMHIRREPRRAMLARRGNRHVTYISPRMTGEGTFDVALPELRVLDLLFPDTFAALERHDPDIEYLSHTLVSKQAGTLVPVFTLAVLMMAAIIAVQFEDLRTPALVLGVLPAGGAGATFALHIAGRAITMQASLGFLVLIGLVVNGSLVLIEHWRRLTAAGVPSTEAVYRGGLHRLRPVLMTALTTIAAILPMAIDPGQRSFHSDMAIAMIGGLIFATGITLLVVPSLYLMVRGPSQ